MDNKQQLEQMIQHSDYSLFVLIKANYKSYTNLFHDLIELGVKYQSVEALQFIHDSMFEIVREREELSAERIVSEAIFKQRQYDFITPCVLGSITTMQAITESFFNYKEQSFLDYLNIQPMIKLHPGRIYDNFEHLFHDSSDLSIVKQMSVKWDNPLIYNCFKSCLKTGNLDGIVYLMDNPLSSELMVKLTQELLENKGEEAKRYSDYSYLVQYINFHHENNHFVISFIGLMKEKFNLSIEPLSAEYFLHPLVRNIAENENETIYQFLKQFYALDNKPVAPESISYIQEWSKYEDFFNYFEKRELENQVNLNQNKSSKIKL